MEFQCHKRLRLSFEVDECKRRRFHHCNFKRTDLSLSRFMAVSRGILI